MSPFVIWNPMTVYATWFSYSFPSYSLMPLHWSKFFHVSQSAEKDCSLTSILGIPGADLEAWRSATYSILPLGLILVGYFTSRLKIAANFRSYLDLRKLGHGSQILTRKDYNPYITIFFFRYYGMWSQCFSHEGPMEKGDIKRERVRNKKILIHSLFTI